MRDIIDLDRYPLDRPNGRAWASLVGECQVSLAREGLFNLPGFVKSDALGQVVSQLQPVLNERAFVHARRHNIYFRKTIPGLSPDDAALAEFETSNRTICADQFPQSALIALYEWPPFIQFLAAVMGKPELFTMPDPLARVNVMGYGPGQALNWHFDRSEFTTTLLLQSPESGGGFEYAKDLRSEDNPNYGEVAALLRGERQPVHMVLEPGTLNVFKGKNTAHRVTPVVGNRDRIIAVFSYYEQPGVMFSEEDRLGFYGRAS